MGEIDNSCVSIPLPVTSNAIRRYSEGKDAIMNTIPTPTIRKHGPTETAYVLLHDILCLYLPYGLIVSSKSQEQINETYAKAKIAQSVGGYWETDRAFELSNKLSSCDQDEDVQKLLISIWSDGCDPNSRNKSNRGSLHITTVSVLSDIDRNCENNTFVVAIGREGGDHSFVRELLYKDIKKLEKTHSYFDGKRILKLQIILLCNLADRPERSETTGFGSHMGELTMRWGHICHIPVNLPSCKLCHCARLNGLTPASYSCTECYDWRNDDIRILVDKDYPSDADGLQDGYIRSHEFCFTGAFSACRLSTDKMATNEWSVKNVKSYLKHIGLNTKIVDRVIANASEENRRELIDICPALWNKDYDIQVKNYVPAIMHLCFLGVTQTTGFLIKETLSNYNKFTKFRENDMMRHMRRFSLTWCRTWTYGSNATPYGPWTAENYLGYSRVFKSVYSICLQILTDARNVNEERRKVAEMIQRLASALNAMMARIMQRNINEGLIADTDRHIKLFLSMLTELDDANNLCSAKKIDKAKTRGKNKQEKKKRERKRKINSTSNLTSLLNIPTFMKEFGPPRLYWEGGYKGEGILRSVKPVVTQGTHMSWFATAALQKYYNNKSMTMLLRNDNNDITHETSKVVAANDRKIFTYKQGIDEITDDISHGRAISAAVVNSSGEVFCLGMHLKKKKFIHILFRDDLGSLVGNTYHCPIEVSCDRVRDVTTDIDHLTYVILLPNRDSKRNSLLPYYTYSCVSENWTERRRLVCGSIEYTLPQVDDASYRSIDPVP